MTQAMVTLVALVTGEEKHMVGHPSAQREDLILKKSVPASTARGYESSLTKLSCATSTDANKNGSPEGKPLNCWLRGQDLNL